MRHINSLHIIALLCVLSLTHWSATCRSLPVIQVAGHVYGTVMDTNDARITEARITIDGEGITRTVSTAEDGTYKVNLPIGIYQIRVNRRGFCPSRRAPFRVQPSMRIMLNFVLTACPIANDLNIVEGQYKGETDRYRNSLEEEVFHLKHPSRVPLEILVQYRGRQKDGHFIEYQGAVISYDVLTIRSDKVRLNTNTYRVEIEESAIIENGKRSIRVKRATVDLPSGKLRLLTASR